MLPFLRRHRMLLLHLSFWGVYLSFFLYQFTQMYAWRWALPFTVVPILCHVPLVYFNYFYLLPRWLKHQHAGRYLLELALPFALAVGLRVAALRHFAPPAVPAAYWHSAAFVASVAVGTLVVVAFVGMLRFVLDWFALEAKTKALENARLLAELQFLKAQINPHFLFNTLNNLYYLAYTQSPHTPAVVARLAHMMRYMLHDAAQPTVALSQEIEYLQNYIGLEQLRLTHPVPVAFEVEGTPPESLRVAPLVLMAFLENVFKHGICDHAPAARISVRLRLRPTGCDYTVSNSRRPAPPAGPAPAGTGLLNVRRRLALSYPGRHTLRIDDSAPDHYRIHLTLELP